MDAIRNNQENFQLHTQNARTTASSATKKKNRYLFPALNVKRRSESAATYLFYCDTSTIDNGSKCAQAFVGTKTLLSDVYGMESDKKFVNSLEDNIRERGEMDKLTSDSAKDILIAYSSMTGN